MENTKSTTIEGKNVGKKCRTHYRGTFNDGTQFDSSYDRGEPLEFVCGAGMMIKGFDAAVASMEVGQTTEVHLMPEEAYGQPDPDAIFTVELAQRIQNVRFPTRRKRSLAMDRIIRSDISCRLTE